MLKRIVDEDDVLADEECHALKAWSVRTDYVIQSFFSSSVSHSSFAPLPPLHHPSPSLPYSLPMAPSRRGGKQTAKAKAAAEAQKAKERVAAEAAAAAKVKDGLPKRGPGRPRKVVVEQVCFRLTCNALLL